MAAVLGSTDMMTMGILNLIPGWPRWTVLTLLGVAIGHTLVMATQLTAWSMAPVVMVWLLISGYWRWGASWPASSPRLIPWALIPLGFWGIFDYLANSFGKVDMGAVFFHLQAGISGHGGNERTLSAAFYILLTALVMLAYCWLVRHDHRWHRLDGYLAITLLVINPMFYSIGQRGAAVMADSGAWLERRYVKPIILETPTRLPNLLILYVESLERTYADSERFGNAYADIAALESDALVFDNVRQIDNTGWTMAGMIASQCGTPLMPAGLLHDSQFEPLHQVVPGARCLGDLLKEQGYQLTFMGGASTRFAGKGLFYRDHGFDTVLGREELAQRITDPDYLNSWGLYDDSLYRMVAEEIRRLDRQPDPWAMVALNLAAHAPVGYPAQSCIDQFGHHDGVDILYSVRCSAWLTRQLIEQLKGEGLLDNSLVVIASDHLTMRVSEWDALNNGKRTNTLLMLGNGLAPGNIHTPATTMDTLPTLLEAMGFTIDWHRAGLGVSLLSNQPTLIERFGADALNRYMREETALQERLWEGLTPKFHSDGQPQSPPRAPVTPEQP